MKFYSKRNEVRLEAGAVLKRHRAATGLKREAEALSMLPTVGLPVPKLLSVSGEVLRLEYIPGVLYADLAETLTREQAQALVRWLAAHQLALGAIKGDLNLRNFLWDGTHCVGLDFEDPPEQGNLEAAFGRVLAFLVSYRPVLSPGKARSAQLFLEACLELDVSIEEVRGAYLAELGAMNVRRGETIPLNEALYLFNQALTEIKEVFTMTRDGTTPLGEEVLQQVAEIAAKWRGRPDMLIPVLHEVQEVAGNGIPKEVARTVSEAMGIPLAKIYSVQTFYSFFSKEPRGKVLIRLCKTAPCHIKGTKKILEIFERELGIKAGETTSDGLFTLETCECIGACDVSPAALVDDTVYGHLTPEKVRELVGRLRTELTTNDGRN